MTVFTVPPEAKAERACFSVLDSRCAEELMIVPQGVQTVEAFDGYIWFEDNAAVSALPIGPQTLVPEALAAHFPENPVWVSSLIFENTLEAFLAEKLRAYGSRLWLLLRPYRHCMALPCRDGMLTPEDYEAPSDSFFSEEFCCRYAVDAQSSLLHLWDTEKTAAQKLRLAQQSGISQIVCFP